LTVVQQARDAWLGVTIPVGEEGGEHGIAEIREVVSTLRPDRIGQGILAAQVGQGRGVDVLTTAPLRGTVPVGGCGHGADGASCWKEAELIYV
jgi:hypothetical protein